MHKKFLEAGPHARNATILPQHDCVAAVTRPTVRHSAAVILLTNGVVAGRLAMQPTSRSPSGTRVRRGPKEDHVDHSRSNRFVLVASLESSSRSPKVYKYFALCLATGNF